MTMIG